MQGTRYDFTGRGRAFIDQHHQGHGLQGTLGDLVEAFERVNATALVKLGRRFVGELAFSQLAIGRHHGHVFWQKSRRDGHRRIQVTTRVVAQVKHQAFELGVLLVDFFQLAGKVFYGAFLKLAQANPGVTGLQHLAPYRLRADFLTRDGDREGAVL